jgi:hypothetical protein
LQRRQNICKTCSEPVNSTSVSLSPTNWCNQQLLRTRTAYNHRGKKRENTKRLEKVSRRHRQTALGQTKLCDFLPPIKTHCRILCPPVLKRATLHVVSNVIPGQSRKPSTICVHLIVGPSDLPHGRLRYLSRISTRRGTMHWDQV